MDCDSSSCLWVCCSDGYGGQVCLLDLEHSTQPQIVANITVSDSKIMCVASIPNTKEEEEKREKGRETNATNHHPPLEHREVTVVDSIRSSDSSSGLSHESVSRSSSSTSEGRGFEESIEGGSEVHRHKQFGEREAEEEGLGDSTGSCRLTPVTRESEFKQNSDAKRVDVSDKEAVSFIDRQEADVYPSRDSSPSPPLRLRRVRSNSAPDLEALLEPSVRQEEEQLAQPTYKQTPQPNQEVTTLSVDRPQTKAWSPLTLRPSNIVEVLPEGSSSECSCMWLGTEGGCIHIYTAGNNLRSRSKRRTLELSTPVHCIR